ncbi:MAG: DNA polymerase I [Clostridia bacterium]|nr:DNA polymerase I [Clostridia bacterium]
MKLLAVDGNSIVNRAFYGVKPLTTKDGQFTNAIYGFMNILNSLIQRENPDGVAVAFDLKAPTFRHKIYDEYKAGRKPMPSELAEQIPVLKELLKLFGYSTIELEGYEADDILGTLSYAAEQNDDVCVISTGDRDSLQLVSEHTTVLLAATKMGRPEIIPCTPEYLMEKYGLTPPQMIELKALMGDSSDNIPGVAGVGEKTATDLIQRFKSIDYIYENLADLEIKEGVRNKLAADKSNAFLSKELGTICRNVPISTNFSDYAFKEQNKLELAAMLRKLEFFKMLGQLGLNDISGAEEKTIAISPAKAFEIVPLNELEKSIKNDSVLTVALKENTLYFAVENLLSCADLSENKNAIINIFATENLKINAVDSKLLYKKLAGVCEMPLVHFDVTLAGYLCSPSSNSYDVTRLANEYLSDSFTIEDNEDDNFTQLANAAMLYKPLYNKIEQTEMSMLLNEIEIPLARVLAEMEQVGFKLDTDGITAMRDKLNSRTAELEKEIYELAGEEFNVKSPAQLGVILFEKLGLKSGKKTKSGYSTTAEILEKLKNDHPIINLVLEYRTITKLNSTYCEGLLKAVEPDGRVRSTFNQTETRTGRISSLEPNLQNIPVRRAEGRELRKFFVAKEGYLLVDADYSQIELRVLAHLAGDKTMINAFKNGEDIHTKTAGEVFNMPPLLVTPKMRSSAKAVNFGIVYGIGAFSLAQDIGVSRVEAQKYIDGYFATYPEIANYMKKSVETAKEKGFSATMFGRRRYLPELQSSNHNLRAFGERVARNMPIQGTAADIIKLAMIKTRDKLLESGLDARVILQVHDELIVEAEESIAKEAGKILEQEMENAVELLVPLLVDIHRGNDWYTAKG